jgi:hypothetical protein
MVEVALPYSRGVRLAQLLDVALERCRGHAADFELGLQATEICPLNRSGATILRDYRDWTNRGKA